MEAANRKRVFAVVVGVMLASAGVSGFDYWQRHLIDQLGKDEVEHTARQMIGLAEYQIDAALTTLDGLAKQGVNTCRDGQVDAVRRAAFSNPWVKEINVVAEGRIRCSSSGSFGGMTKPWSRGAHGGNDRPVIDIIHVGDSETMLRVIRPVRDNTAVTAMIPGALLGAASLKAGGHSGAHVRMTTADGTVIVQRGAEAAGAEAEDQFRATVKSNRFALAATVALPRATAQAQTERGRTLAIAFGAIAVVLIFALIRLMPRRRNDPITEFEQAIAAKEFVPYYQPIVDIQTGRLRGAEVLIRWRKQDGTLVVPSVFIPFAESSGLIMPMTRALMRRACEEVGDILANRPNIKIGFNLAARHFLDETIVRDIQEIFGRSPVRMQQVVLEVTERQPLENLAAARRVIASLQELGCGVAIDDVGTGHGGLSYMLKLGADTIKIDKMFIDGIETEHHSSKIIESLVDLARNMRMNVVAEGVESFEQVMKLRELGILAAQGHVFCPPLPASSFIQLVEAIAPLTNAKPSHDDIEAGDVDERVISVAAA